MIFDAANKEDEEEDSGPNEYDYDDGFLVPDNALDEDYDPSLKSKPKKKKNLKNKNVMLADDDLDTIHEAEQWLSSAQSHTKHGVKRKQDEVADEDEELLRLNKKVKLDKGAAKPLANQLVHGDSDSSEGTEGMAEDDIVAQVRQLKSGNKSSAVTSNKNANHKSNSVAPNEDDELTDEMREEEIRRHLKRTGSQLSRDSQGTQELGEDELLY